MVKKKNPPKTARSTRAVSASKSRAPAPRSTLSELESPLLSAQGAVFQADGSPAAGLIVIVFDQDTGGENRLGETTSGAKGEWRLQYSEAMFRLTASERRGADLFVRVYDEKRNLLATSKPLRNAGTEARIDVKLPERQWVVRGRVVGGRGGLQVLAFDKDLRSEQPLGKPCKLGEDCVYAIAYASSEFARAEKGSADLRVAVCDEAGKELASSPIFFNAGPDVTVDLVLAGADSALSEYERYLVAIAPLLDGVKPAELDANDIDFIVGDTGIDRQHIQWLVLAFQLQGATPGLSAGSHAQPQAHSQPIGVAGFPAANFYGWFRLGLPTVARELWQKSTEELVSASFVAVAQRLIPAVSAAEQKVLREAIEQARREWALRDPLPGTTAALGDLLDTLPTPPDALQQRALAAAINGLQPDDPLLVEKIGTVPGFTGDAAAVARTLRLGQLTGGNLALTKALQGHLEGADRDDASLRKLATLQPDEWIDLAYTHASPDEDAAVLEEAGVTLSAQIEQQQATRVLARQLENGPLSHHPVLAEVGTFLANNPGFDIVSSNINRLEDGMDLQGIEDSGQLGVALKALQRFKSLGASWEDTATLLDNDLYSPPQLLDAGPEQLHAMLGGQLSPEKIAALYQQAAELHDVTFAAMTAALSPLSAPNILRGERLKGDGATHDPGRYKSLGWIAGGTADRVENHATFDAAVVAYQPTLQALFGSQDACTCRHCSSVLSPAAYFVDLLQFVRNASADGQLLERLLHRRPDLQDIELTCSNSHTEVPAIDMALEILENAVALPLTVELPPGATLDRELQDQQPVGAVVRAALEKTVRHFAGEGLAVFAGANGDGTIDWTVVDLHRRWTLNARASNSLVAQRGLKFKRQVDISGIDIGALIRALDQGSTTADAAPALVRAFAPNQGSAFSDYQVSVTPLTPGHSWNLAFRLAIELFIDVEKSEITLRSPGGRIWLKKSYDRKTISGLLRSLEINKIPQLVHQVLIARFPDGGRLEVTPVESKRVLKWLMVSEERAVTLTYSPARLTIAALAYQSGDANADPIAEPENHNPEAYLRLKAASFPWTLPLDLPLEEARAYLERLRSSRGELIAAMLPIDGGADPADAAEVLGLSAAEANLIGVASTTPDLYGHWGIPETQDFVFDAALGTYVRGTPPLVLLRNVSVLMQQSRVSFEELQSLIETKFVTARGTAPLNIVPRTTCKPSEMSLPELAAAHLDRLHRFIRLWRRLGWTVHELDLALDAFGGVLGPDTLLALAQLHRLKSRAGLSVATLVAALDRLETQPWIDFLPDGAPEQLPLYDSIFRREAVRKSADFSAFELRADRGELTSTAISGISAHAEYIGNCIGILPAVVTEWTAAGNPLGIVDKLDLANLSRVTAAANFCAALDMEPAQLANTLRLLGASPFDTASTPRERLGRFLDFIERFRNLSRTGIEAESLRYLLQHYEARGSDVVLSGQQVSQFATTARDAARSVPAAPASQGAQGVAAARTAREDAVVTALASDLGGERELVDELLRGRLRNPADPNRPGVDALLSADFTTTEVAHMPTAPLAPATAVDAALKARVDAADQAAADVIIRLYKSVYACSALKITRAGLAQLGSPAGAGGFSALDFNSLPVSANGAAAGIAGFEQLAALSRLGAIAPGGVNLLHRYIVPADSTAWSIAGARLALASGLGVPELDVEAAATRIHVTTEAHYRDPRNLVQLVNLLLILKKLGASVALAAELAGASPGEAAALATRELARRKFGDSQWHDLIKPVEDKLRERQRSALVDYLVARDQLRDANDLYETYLIDVQTCSCMNTTRLLQATAAVQLFVQRVLLGLEPGASLNPGKREMWSWIQNYRVWEANRKVFLFPENWLLPELRDDKTDIFRQMESTLSEGEPSPDSMRSGLLGYLEELGDVAQIRVIAMYQDLQVVGYDAQGQDLEKRTLYVIGRTPNTPYRYFWRSCSEFGSERMSWSGWEALELDNANDFIMPFVFGGELHVAWPILRRTKEQKTEEHDTAKLQWEVQLAWTRRTNKGWVKRKIGSAQLAEVPRLSNKDEAASFAFRFGKQELPVPGGNLLKREVVTIDCYAASELVPVPSFYPDQAMEDSDPVGWDYDKDHGFGYRWNVNVVIQGTLYAYFDRTQEQGGRYYEPCKGTVKVIGAARQSNIFDKEWLPNYVFQTDTDGRFLFSFPTYHGGANGSEGLVNGGSFKLRIEIPGAPTFEKIVTLRHDVPGHDPEYSLYWTWNINHGVQDASLAARFDQARRVKLSRVGQFVFETGKDLVAVLTAAADFQPDLEVFRSQNNALPQPVQAPAAAVRATQLGGSVDPDIWYLVSSDNSFAFAQSNATTWRRWADGQSFVSTYRISAATSAVTLFRGENQSHLHLDPEANTFDRQNVYANYNWELFLHAPLAIADFLSSQRRFEDARRWLHAVFDPTTDEMVGGVPQYWRFLPFSNDSRPDSITKLLTWLADPNSGDPTAENALSFQIDQWRQNPFMPHLIARLRPSAYQWHAFFAYLDVLIKWGDELFRRDTRESVNEATLLYVLAAKLLGPRPRTIQAPASLPPQTYRSLAGRGLDDFSNAWIQYADLAGVRKLLAGSRKRRGARGGQNNYMRADMKVGNMSAQSSGTQLLTSFSLAFCVPQNEKITEYYDLLEKRLFDIRHCRNIEGVVRELPLYDPPIDPLLLIRARAAGLDISTVIADMHAPLPNYRFLFTLQKAMELCAEVKSLGAGLISALEKQDAEELGLLRSGQEIAMLKLVRDVRQKQLDEADANILSLQQSQATATERFSQFQKLLGKTGITRGQDGLPVVEQSSSLAVSSDPTGRASGLGLSRMETDQLRFSAFAHLNTQIAGSVQVVAGLISLIPNIFAGTPFAGQTSGGTNFGIAANSVAKSVEMLATEANYLAGQAGTFGGYERRQDEWVYQSRLALAELKQLEKQALAAQIRKSIAGKELENHVQQIANATAVDEFMRGKFSNQQLFKWTSSQIADVYFRTYQLALDQARRAERAFQRELGLDAGEAPYVRPDNWDGLKRGLLAGERLHNDLKRMECAYLERNVREFEISRHVSLLQLDPMALISLRETGACDFSIPEELFDLDCPGHYLRRIRMVSLSIPCITGSFTSVAATLRLQENSIRMKPAAGNYERLPPGQDDTRFSTNTAPTMAVVTSSSQQDSGMFEPNMRDDRYLPFEGAGVISRWRLELPAQFRQFDYDTISDVILHVRYTARDGGESLRDAATAHLAAQIGKAEASGMVRLFSVRHEFPSAWARFVAAEIGGANASTAELSLELRAEHYPFWSRASLKRIKSAMVIARVGEDLDEIEIDERLDGTGKNDRITRPTDPAITGLLMGTLTNLAPKSPVSEPGKPLKLYFKDNDVRDLWIAVAWQGPAA